MSIVTTSRFPTITVGFKGKVILMLRDTLVNELKHHKIPESEYSFEYKSEMAEDCIYIEHNDDFWDVCDNKRKENKIVGRFPREYNAYIFLFYLVMKRHVPLKKRWF